MADIQEKLPNFFHRFLVAISKIIPLNALGPIFGVLRLVLRRIVQRQLNLYPAPLLTSPKDGSTGPNYRTPTGEGNDTEHYLTGSTDTAFGRNIPPSAPNDPARDPAPQVIAAKLLHRQGGLRPAGMQLNVLAAAWIQAMSHDWFGHPDSEDSIVLDKSTPKCPLKSFSFKATKKRPDGAFDNFRTHWWDASFVYGQTDEDVNRARTFKGGRLHAGNIPGALPRDEQGRVVVGDAKNGWLGVALLQDIFLREHNAVADAIINAHPELKDNDEKVFNYARLVVAAIVAKIHTVDWTVELLKTRTLKVGLYVVTLLTLFLSFAPFIFIIITTVVLIYMLFGLLKLSTDSNFSSSSSCLCWSARRSSNWYGLPKSLGISGFDGPPGPFSLVGRKKTENHGVPYCLTEEFVSVYRLHPLLPDGLLLDDDTFIPLLDMVGQKGDDRLNKVGAPVRFWKSIVAYPCGNLELFNYPEALRKLPPTDRRGVAQKELIDLAALDIYRDRERRVRSYNDFRRGLMMRPFENIRDLCGDNDEAYHAIAEVYGKDGIEKVDLQVGMLAEKKPEGFAISETAFLIFLLMASRRLESDRFLNQNFNKETYSDIGFEWVKTTNGMRDVLRRHFPEVDAIIKEDQSAFTPQRSWPLEYTHNP